MRIIFLILFLFGSAFAGTEAIIKADQADGLESVKNYMKEKAHFEKSINGWSSYADAAGTRPVDGTSGAATLTCTRSTTSPITGDGSLIITKDAANRQGQGCAAQFTIGNEMKAKIMQIEMDYRVVSGTFVAGSSTTDSDLIVYIYDVTNSTLIEPSSIKFLSTSTTLPDKFVANFQTSATGTTYNLIIHQATTSASAFVVMLDNFRTTPSRYVYGTPITDWVSYSLTIGGSSVAPTLGTTTTNAARWRRVGDSMQISYSLVQTGAGTAGTGYYTFPLPSGYTADTNKILIGNNNVVNIGASAAYNGTTVVLGVAQLIDANKIVMTATSETSAPNQIGSTFYQLSGGTIQYGFTAQVPITGWSSSVQQSDSYSSREIGIVVSNPTSAVTGSLTDITTWGTVTKDFTGSFNATTGVFTSPSQGMYKFSGSFLISATIASTDRFVEVDLNVNGTAVRNTQVRGTISNTNIGMPFAFEYPLNAGDTVKLQIISNSTTPAFNAGAAWNYYQISKNQAPTTISATELIAAGYSLSANKTPGASAALDFDSKLYDTHNAVTTGGSGAWRFTAPASGIYEVNMTGALTAGSQTVDLYKNGVQGKVLMSVNSTAVTSGSASVSLVAGDYISANPDGSVTFSSTKNTNIYIKRLK